MLDKKKAEFAPQRIPPFAKRAIPSDDPLLAKTRLRVNYPHDYRGKGF